MNNQTCPYCGRELEQGTFHSRGGNYFLPNGEKTPSFYTEKATEKRKAILLPPDAFSAERPQYPDAYLCRACQKIIIPYEYPY